MLSFWPGWVSQAVIREAQDDATWQDLYGLSSPHELLVVGLSYRPVASGCGLQPQFEGRISAMVRGKPYSFIIAFIPLAAAFWGRIWESFKSIVVSYPVSFIQSFVCLTHATTCPRTASWCAKFPHPYL